MKLFTAVALSSLLLAGTSLAQTSGTATSPSSTGPTTTGSSTGTGTGPSAATPGATGPTSPGTGLDTRTGRTSPDMGVGTRADPSGMGSGGSAYGTNPVPNSSVTRDSTSNAGTGTGSYLPTPGGGDRITVPDTRSDTTTYDTRSLDRDDVPGTGVDDRTAPGDSSRDPADVINSDPVSRPD